MIIDRTPLDAAYAPLIHAPRHAGAGADPITSLGGFTLTGDISPDSPDTRSIGSVAKELLNLYMGDAGKIFFGLAQDVNLYRSAADVLKTDDDLEVAGDIGFGEDKALFFRTRSVTDWYMRYYGLAPSFRAIMGTSPSVWNGLEIGWISAEAEQINARIKNNGVIELGSAGTIDVNLYRSAADVLKTDDNLHFGAGLIDDSLQSLGSGDFRIKHTSERAMYIRPDENGIIMFFENSPGGPQEAYFSTLMADATNTLRDSSRLIFRGKYWTGAYSADRDATIMHDMLSTTPTSQIGFEIAGSRLLNILSDGRLDIGGAGDVNLYRSAADVLKTDDQFQPADGVVVKVKTGAHSDADYTVDTDGLIGVDDTVDAERIYFRAHGSWFYINKSGGFSFPEKNCLVCGKDIQVGDELAMVVDKARPDGVHALPCHVKCTSAYKELEAQVERFKSLIHL